MHPVLPINDILIQIKKLNKEQQLTLLEKILSFMRNNEKPADPIKLSTLAGVGSGTWSGIDIDAYLEQERKW